MIFARGLGQLSGHCLEYYCPHACSPITVYILYTLYHVCENWNGSHKILLSICVELTQLSAGQVYFTNKLCMVKYCWKTILLVSSFQPALTCCRPRVHHCYTVVPLYSTVQYCTHLFTPVQLHHLCPAVPLISPRPIEHQSSQDLEAAWTPRW